jgi:transaldolase
MRLFLDSADQKQWEEWAETGLFYGFTTNPSILKRDNVQCTLQALRNLTRHAVDLDVEELQIQAWGSTWNDLYSCGLDLYELDSNIITVKVPMTQAGVKAAHRLMLDDVPVTLTGVHSTHQVVTALAVGGFYVAPYLGRMNDAGKNVRRLFILSFFLFTSLHSIFNTYILY